MDALRALVHGPMSAIGDNGMPDDRYTLVMNRSGHWSVLGLGAVRPRHLRDGVMIQMSLEQAHVAADLLNQLTRLRRPHIEPVLFGDIEE